MSQFIREFPQIVRRLLPQALSHPRASIAVMELENFGDALDALVESGAEHYGDCASMVVLHQMEARLDSFVTEATAAFEVGEEWAAEGAKTAASWIATSCRVDRRAAKRRVRLGRTLRHLPLVTQA